MGFRDLIRRPLYQASLQRPWSGKATAEIVRVTPKGGDLAVLDVNIYTGDESPWQGPRPYSFRTILPKGVQPRVGQVVLVGEGGGGTGNNSPPPVFWDEPAPALPPMQFPMSFGGDDPQGILDTLTYMVQNGTLDQEGFGRARVPGGCALRRARPRARPVAVGLHRAQPPRAAATTLFNSSCDSPALVNTPSPSTTGWTSRFLPVTWSTGAQLAYAFRAVESEKK